MSDRIRSIAAGLLALGAYLHSPPDARSQPGLPTPRPGPSIRVFRPGDDGWKNPEKLPPPTPLKEGDGGRVPPAEDAGKDGTVAPAALPARSGYDLDGLIALTLRQNPRLVQAGFAIDAARGRAVQAGLYPNPVVAIVADEVADRTGRVGIINAPQVSQEIVRGGKLQLSRAAVEREVDQAALSLASLRYQRLAAVRLAYYDLLTLQRRLEILDELVRLAKESVTSAEKLQKAGQASRLDFVQLEVEQERLRAEQEATRREIAPAHARLAAAVGVRDLPRQPVLGTLELPQREYDLEKAKARLLADHPDIRSARVGVDRAKLLLERARVEPTPNVTVQAGYVYQGQNRSNDFNVGVSMPVPVWNRNQGNIRAAQAELGEAVQQIGRTENELSERLADSFRAYAAARQRADRYRRSILPVARESYELSLKGYRAGQFDYLRVLEAQRAYSQADLEAVRSLGEMWRAAADLSGLLLEDEWPACPPGQASALAPKEAPAPKTDEAPKADGGGR